jgi:hypothetical protein
MSPAQAWKKNYDYYLLCQDPDVLTSKRGPLATPK